MRRFLGYHYVTRLQLPVHSSCNTRKDNSVRLKVLYQKGSCHSGVDFAYTRKGNYNPLSVHFPTDKSDSFDSMFPGLCQLVLEQGDFSFKRPQYRSNRLGIYLPNFSDRQATRTKQ